ncbi:MAG: archaemetzincin family Zn-dependent metalloprotease [Acidobacteriales bacterium]|nr:archaemetzincin family Zn-dependent metalloprotease [Candidatus Koribacter versatilis]MBI3645666.1 archaemetzincin family Zn-dependent metalloprotease [Terriglobales bacterium]
MKMLDLLPIGNFDERLLREVAPALADAFHVPCQIVGARLDPQFAFHRERQQYHSSELLQAMQELAANGAWRVLGITSVDLYIPILTFVFGEAQMGGPCAVVSFHRLMQEFYGLPADPAILIERVIKESVHEVGHTLDLTHCDDYACAMAPSHAVEWIDLKEAMLCPSCQSRALEIVG